jgi:UDP-N-acetylmuramoyl-tripeptide--D-alanyl-D-alanine ligase
MHREAVRDASNARPAALIAVGPEMGAAVCSASSAELPPIVHICADSREAAGVAREIVRPGDVLLVKGSRGIAMEHVVASLCS